MRLSLAKYRDHAHIMGEKSKGIMCSYVVMIFPHDLRINWALLGLWFFLRLRRTQL